MLVFSFIKFLFKPFILRCLFLTHLWKCYSSVLDPDLCSARCSRHPLPVGGLLLSVLSVVCFNA